jgi:hypothetical protein
MRKSEKVWRDRVPQWHHTPATRDVSNSGGSTVDSCMSDQMLHTENQRGDGLDCSQLWVSLQLAGPWEAAINNRVKELVTSGSETYKWSEVSLSSR